MSTAPQALPTPRAELLRRLGEPREWDLAVVGGGATGLGVALDAAARGLSVVLIDSHDFAQGTSSRATKLVHGGVRYLAQGNLSLVREALAERARLLHNAPHLAQPLSFLMPSYRWWEIPFYGIGLALYDALAGRAGLGRTRWLGRRATLAALPNAMEAGLRGGVEYWDGQFDDARLALALARTAARHGALLVNHCEATGLLHRDGRVCGLTFRSRAGDTAAGGSLQARCVVNATGVWVDGLRTLDGLATGRTVRPMVAPSQGVHLVVDRRFWPADRALLVPRTVDGRVLFAVPWLGKVILGTTDTPRQQIEREPQPLSEEVRFILEEAARYLAEAPGRADVRSVWVGLRPLVRPDVSDGSTRGISREHTVVESASGLVTVTGGKWTTYRAMAEDVLERCMASGRLPRRPAGATADLPLVGATGQPAGAAAAIPLSAPPGLHLYGTDADLVNRLPGASRWLAPGLSEAMVRFAARYEYALTVSDVLARRSRMLFLDAALADRVADDVAAILTQETGLDPDLTGFRCLAQTYQTLPPP